MILLVDADIVLWKMSYVNEVEYDWGNGIKSKTLNTDMAIDQMYHFLNRMQRKTGAEGYINCFTSSPNFRYEVLPTYKHNRSGTSKPDLFPTLKADLIEHTQVLQMPHLEADDVMGIYGSKEPDKYIIASIDKDLKQIPAWHYNWDSKELFEVTEEEGDHFFYTQILKGDSVDGYGGCPYIGEKRAAKILAECETHEDYWDAIVEAYEAKELTEQDAIQQARVARILRHTDYDWETKEPILWTP